MATRKTTTTKTTGGTTGGKTTTTTTTTAKATKATKTTKAPNALSTTTDTNSTEAITTALKQVQQSIISLTKEVETIKETMASHSTTTSATSGVTVGRMDTLLTIINQYAVWTDGFRANQAITKWKQNKI